jgi:agmatine deiminase
MTMPSLSNYRMPAEFETHEATWLSWPHNPETWPGRLKFIPPIWVQMLKPLHVHETVHICVNDQAMEDDVRAILKRHDISPNVILHQIPTNDAWARDHNGIFVVPTSTGKSQNAPLQIVDWIFNSWGKKYGPWELDDVVPQHVAKSLNIPCVQPGIVLEGGSIDVNGRGTLLTTEQCLLNKNRNPHLSRSEIEGYLKNYLGVSNVLWLGDGIVGDDTDGHVDDITRFVNPTTVVTVVEEDPNDENYKALQDNLKRLRTMKDQDGRLLDVVTIPMPGPISYDGQRLPASYANFYIANGVVLVPTYNHANDARAVSTLQKLFPTRRVIGIPCVEMVWGLGAIHCVTQQQPKV